MYAWEMVHGWLFSLTFLFTYIANFPTVSKKCFCSAIKIINIFNV